MVAMNVWPTDGADGSVATEARWRKMGRLWARTAVANGFDAVLAFPNLTVQPGVAWVDGHYTELTSPQVLTVSATGLVVIRFDPAANSAELLYRDGVTTPTTNAEGVWELPLYAMSGSVLTDRRAYIANAHSTLAVGNAGPSPVPRAAMGMGPANISGIATITSVIYAANANVMDPLIGYYTGLGGGTPDGAADWSTFGFCAQQSDGSVWKAMGSLSMTGPVVKGVPLTCTIGINSSHVQAANCYVSVRTTWTIAPYWNG